MDCSPEALVAASDQYDSIAPGDASYVTLNLTAEWFTASQGITPDELPGLIRWWDADFYSLANGASITSAMPWVDQSPVASNATPTNGHEPTFRTNIFGILPAVRFVGQQRMRFDSGAILLPTYSILCVARANGDSIFLSHSDFNRQTRINRTNQNKNSVFHGTTEIISASAFIEPASDARMNGFVRPNDNVTFFDNRNPVAGVNTDANDHFLNQIGIIDGGPLNIDIGELVIYSGALSAAQVQQLYDEYFKPKFSLP